MDDQSQAIETFAHVGVPGRQPHLTPEELGSRAQSLQRRRHQNRRRPRTDAHTGLVQLHSKDLGFVSAARRRSRRNRLRRLNDDRGELDLLGRPAAFAPPLVDEARANILAPRDLRYNCARSEIAANIRARSFPPIADAVPTLKSG